MKKILPLLFFIIVIQLHLTAQNVGINATGSRPDPSAMLDVKATDKGMLIPRMTGAQRVAIVSPATGLMVFDTDINSFYTYNGAAAGWVQINYWTNTGFNSTDIYNTNGRNVGIGTNNPITKLTVQTLSNSYGVTQTDGTVTVGTYIGASEGWLGTRSNHPLTFFTNNGGQQMTLAVNGNVGIANNSPANRLEIGHTPYGGYDFAIGDKSNSSNGMAFLLSGTSTNWWSTGDIFINPGSVAGTPHIGIGVLSAANKLQIGSMGAAGFNGNDFAIGNGTNALGVFQSNTATQFASSTDIILLPRINGGGVGRVGINTSTPRAPLDVVNSVTAAFSNTYVGYAYYSVQFAGGEAAPNEGSIINTLTDGNISIYASDRILATEFDAYSDARIKNITDISNTSKDLETLNALRITDYTMKDKVKYGNKPFKKVIAQDVEKVYPQVVSTHTDFIPNVYQLSNKIEKVSNGYLLHFTNKHNIGTNAKRLQLLLPNKDAMQQFDIVAIPNDKEVIIVQRTPVGEATDLNADNADKIFVYGEEVNDFRTVDYEGLTTLNISATQELSKLIALQNKKIEAMEREIKFLESKRD
jgi:hypothetical protein